MTVNVNRLTIAVLAVAFMVSCTSAPDDTLLIWDIEGDVGMELSEQIVDGISSLDLAVNTQDRSFCENATVMHRLSVEDQSMDLDIIGVQQGDGCSDPGFQATTLVDLPELTASNYSILVTLPQHSDVNGLLRITDEAYILDIPTSDGLFLPYQTLFKTPAQLIYGEYIDNTEDKEASNALLEALINYDPYLNGGSPPLLYEGVYQHFVISIGPTSLVTLTPLNAPLTGPGKHRGFFGGTQEELKTLMDNWRAEWGNEDIELYLRDATGNEY